MYTIYEPVSGEKGYFCSEAEKVLIDAIIQDFSVNHLVTQEASTTSRGVWDE